MEILFIVLGLVLSLVEAFVVYKGVWNTRRASLLQRLPLSRIGELEEPGLVKVLGRAVALEGTFRSPLANRPCLYFHFQVQEKRQRHAGPHGGGGAYWKTVINDAQSLPCAIDDGTGEIELRLDQAEFELMPDDDERSGFLNTARPELEAMLQKDYGYSSVGLIFNRTLSYQETRIEAGDELLVVGTVRQTGDDAWELVRGRGPLLVSNKSQRDLRASYANAAVGWWLLAVLMPVVVGVVYVFVR